MTSFTGSLKLSDGEVTPAKVDGPSDVFTYPDFILAKPRWISDDEVNVCTLCNNKFNQIRRKHHCRQCGRVLCNKCSKEKLLLPHLGIDDPERVCDWCRPVTEMITKSRSQNMLLKEEAAKSLSIFCCDDKYLKQVIQLGGIQSLIALTASLSHETAGKSMFKDVMIGLHTLTSNPTLHQVLVEAGIIKCINSILTRASKNDVDILTRGISSLMIFCKSPEFRNKVLEDGTLDLVLSLCSNHYEAVSLVAVRTLGLIVSNTVTHDAIFDSERHALPKILTMTLSEDEQMQEGSLKILAHLACGKDWHKHRIVQEAYSSDRCLQKVVYSQPKNKQILCNAFCLVANLATSADDQGGLQELLQSTCNVLHSVPSNQKDVLCNVSRALANFAKYPDNSQFIIPVIPDIMEKCIKSETLKLRENGMRILFYLFHSHSADHILNNIRDSKDLLRCIVEEKGLLLHLESILQQKSPAVQQPE